MTDTSLLPPQNILENSRIQNSRDDGDSPRNMDRDDPGNSDRDVLPIYDRDDLGNNDRDEPAIYDTDEPGKTGGGEEGGDEGADNTATDSTVRGSCGGRWPIVPEVASFLYFLALVTQSPVMQFWLYDHFAREFNLPDNDSDNETDVCRNQSGSTESNRSRLEEKVQSHTNSYVLYNAFISSFLAIFPTILVGPLTDRFGRKFVVYISCSGLLCNLILNTFVFYYDLPPTVILISSLFLGVSGSYGLFLVACFGMVADITVPGRPRAVRVTTMEATMAIAMSIGTSVAGTWVKEFGYVWPMAASAGVVVLSLLYFFFLVPETLSVQHHRSFSCKTFLKSFEFYVKDTPDKRRFKLIVYMLCFLTVLWGLIAESSIGILYLLHTPFCWHKDQITLFTGVLSMLKWVAVMIFILATRRCISLQVFLLVGSVSVAAGFYLKGLAQNSIMILFAGGASLLADLVGPMSRTLMSKSVSADEQGAMFAGIGVLQMIVTAVSGVAMSALYSVGLGVYLGLPYLVLGAMVSGNVILMLAAIIYERRHPAAPPKADDDDEKMIS